MAKKDKSAEAPANATAPVSLDKMKIVSGKLEELSYKTLNELKTGIKNIRTGPLPDIPELMASIEQRGMMYPLIVQPTDGGYNITDGFRRLQALVKLHEKHGDGWFEKGGAVDFNAIPVSVFEGGNELWTKLTQVTANLQRVDTEPEDLFAMVKELLNPPYNLDIPEIGNEIGKNSNFVINLLKYGEKVDTETKKLVKDGKMTFAQAVAAVDLPEEFREKIKEAAKTTSNKTEAKKKVKAALDAATGAEESSAEKAAKKGNKEIEDRLTVCRGILTDEKYFKFCKKEDVANLKAYMNAFEWALGQRNSLPIPKEAEDAFLADYAKKQEQQKAQTEADKLKKQADAAAVKLEEMKKKAEEKAAAAQAAAKAAGAAA